MRNKQQVIDAIYADMKEMLTEARKWTRRGNNIMTTAALKCATECRNQLYDYMDEEQARSLHTKAYEDVFGGTNERDRETIP